MSNAYLSRGVSATKDDVHKAISHQDSGEFSGTFCKLIPDPCGDPAYCAVMHADGAGTKSSLAYLVYRETGDLRPLRQLAVDAVVMNLDDMLCVGSLGPFVLSNTIGRNAHVVDGSCIKAIIEGYEDVCRTLGKYGIDMQLAGGETADVGDLTRTLIVDATCFARLPRAEVINCNSIQAGDVIVGLASFGQAVYETQYNAGTGSNGLTAARHLLLHHDYAAKYPETYSPTIDDSLVYCGPYHVSDVLPGTSVTVGDAVLSPTRTYAPILRDVLLKHRDTIHGIIHCTGGGQTKCKNFGRGLHYIKDDLFELPPLFSAIRETGSIAPREMYQVFNMGHRMELYTDRQTADCIINIAQAYGVEARIVGRTEAAEDGKNHVTIRQNGDEWLY